MIYNSGSDNSGSCEAFLRFMLLFLETTKDDKQELEGQKLYTL